MIRKCLLCLLSLCMLATSACAQTAEAPSADVTAMFLNVGKADAALYLLDGHAYMVDVGAKDGVDVIMETLAAQGIQKLDGVILTHTHNDHVGGLKQLLKKGVQIDKLYASSYSIYESEQKNPITKTANKYDQEVQWLELGDEVRVTDEIAFRVIGPMERDAENENNNSLVLLLQTPEGDLLLTGDMEKDAEQRMLAAKAVPQPVVLKVGHHGEDDASSRPFLYAVKPQIAVISTNTEEEPDTPDPKVLDRLRELDAQIYVTQQAQRCVRVTLQNGEATVELQ